MLWLCIALPQLPLEALRSAQTDEAVVVTACEGSTRWIICCNPAAECGGLKPSLNFTVALAIHPQVVALERKQTAEQSALERLAGWAYQFSGTVILGEIADDLRRARMSVLWLEIGASLKLFGGFRKLMEQFEQELQELQYTYRLGIGPTLEGAALLARAEVRVAITTLHALYMRIRSLPIARLSLDPEITQPLHIAGVRTIGLLLELPRDGVARRFGPDVSNFLDRLVGVAADPRPVFRPPAAYRARFEFEFEVRSTQALLFPVRRMLRELAGFLRGLDTGVQHFTLTFVHRDMPATCLRIGVSTPDRNADKFFSLVREQLERTEFPAPTLELRLAADEFAAPTALQPDFFTGALQQSEELSHTIDRLAARLGDEQVHALRPMADHRPEASWATAPLEEKRARIDFAARPLWLLPEPQPLQYSAIPPLTSGPERIEAGWWDGRDVQRDYFILRTSNGADLWVFKDLSNGTWHLHGFWS